METQRTRMGQKPRKPIRNKDIKEDGCALTVENFGIDLCAIHVLP